MLFGELYPIPLIYEVFLLWLEGTGAISSPVRALVTWGFLLSAFQWFSPRPWVPPVTHWQISSQPKFLQISRVLLCSSTLWGSALQLRATLILLNCGLNLHNSERLLSSVWVPSSCTQSWLLWTVNEKSLDSPHLFPFCQGSQFCTACFPVSESVACFLSGFLVVESRKVIPGPYTPWWLSVDVCLYFWFRIPRVYTESICCRTTFLFAFESRSISSHCWGGLQQCSRSAWSLFYTVNCYYRFLRVGFLAQR